MKDILDVIIEEVIISELGMKSSKLSDKYGEVIGSVVDNLAAIVMYPDSQAVQHWRQRAGALVKRFVDLDVEPIRKNNEENRLRIFQKGAEETLNKDYSAIKNHFRSVSAYYSKPNNPNGVMHPYDRYDICYEENKDKVFNAVNEINRNVAMQDYDAILELMENF